MGDVRKVDRDLVSLVLVNLMDLSPFFVEPDIRRDRAIHVVSSAFHFLLIHMDCHLFDELKLPAVEHSGIGI